MSTLERGFKTWCERRAASLRRDLALADDEPIDVFDLARALRITLLTPKEVTGLDRDHLKQLLDDDSRGWSAVTLEVGSRKVVIYNSSHSPGRIASNIAHEIAHLLLEHTGSKTVLSTEIPFLLRAYDAKQEDEANWLGWTILLPRKALLRARSQGKSPAAIATEFGVSKQLATFRVRRTGVDRQISRSKASR